jgi:hypothetical protein
MLQLSDDILIHILNIYTNNYIKCIKNNKEIEKLYACEKIKSLIINNVMCKLMCNLFVIKKKKIKICTHHNNVSMQYLNRLVQQLNYADKKTLPKICHNNNSYNEQPINICSDTHLNFIHMEDLKKNEKLVRYILKKYQYKLVHFCCKGDGCRITKIK